MGVVRCGAQRRLAVSPQRAPSPLTERTQRNCTSSLKRSCGLSSWRKCPQSIALPVTGAADFSRQVASTSHKAPTVPFPPHRTWTFDFSAGGFVGLVHFQVNVGAGTEIFTRRVDRCCI
jgi:hypothetical protein